MNIPYATVHKILNRKLHKYACTIQVVQMLQEHDYHTGLNFSQQIKFKMIEFHEFLE